MSCDERVNAKKDELELQFDNLLERLCLPKRLVKLVDAEFSIARENHQASKEKRKTAMRKEIQRLKKQQKTIEQSLIITSKPKLYQSLEEQRASLDYEI